MGNSQTVRELCRLLIAIADKPESNAAWYLDSDYVLRAIGEVVMLHAKLLSLMEANNHRRISGGLIRWAHLLMRIAIAFAFIICAKAVPLHEIENIEGLEFLDGREH
ncbi:hypothetical protein ACH5RR_007526 [Cinchona calisaya]|uniref:Uncharacterized protein n=1 Tax=Cinchona calisaya TaxID=153742 RepID=A0ABD3AS64_9GENT